ncbi:S8 family peptidase [Maribacter sp. PR1]|uniref:S8 family peptidase n=1 Tax=Maribacter cobaltidurans TaxID=1178778 RepID=A0ABU7IQQ9_9FLAO|nr:MULTISPECIES: S8 family peptidase [Maribacter]MDC6387906.1 S8 family peptidase [Maribacter sp. PR1]MEE1975295.1 S8 family peptidase [Maribacter cobaltidurans]
MPNRHTYLQNEGKENNGFKKTRGFSSNQNPDAERIINRARIAGLYQDLQQYDAAIGARNERRTINFPSHIDLLWIHFFVPYNDDLRKKFYARYGLLPQAFNAFNKSVLFEVVDQGAFEQFQEHLTYLNNQDTDVPYTQQDFNLIALIDHFEFLDNRIIVPTTEGAIFNLVSPSQKIAITQQERLNKYLDDARINFDSNQSGDLYFIHQLTEGQLHEISDNFDVVQAITSSRPLTVRPGTFGELRMSYGFTTTIIDNLPIVGVIDTGVNTIEPFEGLILPTINITDHPDQDQSGHGTLVAGLCIFGSELPATVQEEYQAKCRVLPIKVLHHDTDAINFPAMLKAIRQANNQHGVRIFNMSLTMALVKNYNETFSYFAYELDKLSHSLDILIFISVGNFDSVSLQELLTTDYHQDHDYPTFFYCPNSTSPVHRCENTNICVPSESLNNLSIGSLAGNYQQNDHTDISPSADHPAFYSRKSHYDYNRDVNNKPLLKHQKNKYLNKPDLVVEGGDLHHSDSGIEVLTNPGHYYTKTAGTSLSTPLISSMAAELIKSYPSLNMQSIKALLINSSDYFKSGKFPEFAGTDPLLKKLVGFGKPNKAHSLEADDNSIIMVLEKIIRNDQLIAIPINLPEYLLTAENKLIINITMSFKFLPDRGNHLAYLPLHIGFNLVQNKRVTDIALRNADHYKIKSGFSWSEDHYGLENALFSNVQKKEYRLQPSDIVGLDGSMAIAVRCVSKSNIDSQLLHHYRTAEHPFSIVITVTEEVKNETEHNLYEEMLACNNLTIIPEIDISGEANLETEN